MNDLVTYESLNKVKIWNINEIDLYLKAILRILIKTILLLILKEWSVYRMEIIKI